MKKMILCMLVLAPLLANAQQLDSMQMIIDTIEANFTYQHGEIEFENGIGKLNVPAGFKYLDSEQSAYVIKDLWGNPDGTGTLGMIVPESSGMLSDNAWAFIITYEELGYVKDDDADDIDYDGLLEDMREDAKSANEERTRLGYETIELVGWAAKPFYDAEKKVLHWAKEIKFGESEFNTLNYNVRILGRKGVVVLNAVAPMAELQQVQSSIPAVLPAFTYGDGNQYSDFDPEIDEVAAWTIGGLVAGKVLAKAGILALLLKNIKLIGIGVVALFGGLWRWYKRKTSLPTVRNISDSSDA